MYGFGTEYANNMENQKVKNMENKWKLGYYTGVYRGATQHPGSPCLNTLYLEYRYDCTLRSCRLLASTATKSHCGFHPKPNPQPQTRDPKRQTLKPKPKLTSCGSTASGWGDNVRGELGQGNIYDRGIVCIIKPHVLGCFCLEVMTGVVQ